MNIFSMSWLKYPIQIPTTHLSPPFFPFYKYGNLKIS